jgi:pyruvate formate-lyase activating enzyme-like uncharacterized protein
MKDHYPAMLQTILNEIAALDSQSSNLETVQPRWRDYLARAAHSIPGIQIDASGEIVYLGGLSTGCQACKDGNWDCVFITMRCNLICPFCYSPKAVSADFVGSVFGTLPEEIVDKYKELGIKGIGFSGGEPFMDVERLAHWLKRFKQLYPDAYYWVYTNGLLANETELSRLGDFGLDEIRFNLAATGYDHPEVLKNVAAAARMLSMVTVEIPSIPTHAQKVLDCLALWADMGVRTLNIHELIYEPGTRSESMAGERVEFFPPDGHRVVFNPNSRELTLAIFTRISVQGLAMAVNDCSMQSKFRQLRGRRRNIYSILRLETEKLVEDRVYESICVYKDNEAFVIHPDDYQEALFRFVGYRFVRLRRRAPLSLQERPKWLAIEEL